MNILYIFGLSAGILSAVCYIPYIRDVLSGSTRPERASWFIWSILGSIAFFSQLNKGATDSLWLTAVQTIGVTVVFLLALQRGTGGLNRRDIYSLIVAGFGLLLWYFTNNAIYALILVIIVDCAGAILTLLKAYEDPKSETLITWLLAGIAGIFAMASVGTWNIELLAYPIYIAVINLAVVGAMILGRRKNHG